MSPPLSTLSSVAFPPKVAPLKLSPSPTSYPNLSPKAQSVNNKWVVIYLLKIIFEDHHTATSPFLPNLTFLKPTSDKAWNNDILLLSKDLENHCDITFHKFVNLVKEETEILG
ncbi:hypothetical protein VNO78_01121 [Psophocarpus tetragonolobus]|uniref:Uncharacterized protein n=1 Tax=Psophocarpus tetragonolobus TaxID=3891 RepID=A0AAN9XVD6_PSOTE